MHPTELAYPCCLPALGEFGKMPPHGGLPRSLGDGREGSRGWWVRISRRLTRPVASSAEDSPSGLWRSLGKRVGLIALRGSNPLSSATPMQSLTCENADRRPQGGRSAFVVSGTRSLSFSLSWFVRGCPLPHPRPGEPPRTRWTSGDGDVPGSRTRRADVRIVNRGRDSASDSRQKSAFRTFGGGCPSRRRKR